MFTQFTDPAVLETITLKHLVRFFDHFQDELVARKLPVPYYIPGSEGYNESWAELLKASDKLPETLRETIQAIEQLIAPQNQSLLETKIKEAQPTHVYLDTANSAACSALQLWLIAPYTFKDGQFTSASSATLSSTSSDTLSTPHPPFPHSGHSSSTIDSSSAGAPAILPSVSIDSDHTLAKYFMPHQIHWIQAEDAIHAQNRQVFALAEKSVRIGWTHADSFKNVRKRLRFRDRDYLFATKDYQSALQYIRETHKFVDFFNLTKNIISHGEDALKINRLDEHGRPTGFTEEIKMGYIKFNNGSSIRAFSAHPQAMAVYGGDVGLDEFAKHSHAKLLWETAQGRITWAFDMAVWSAHDGEDTLFYQFAQEAKDGLGPWNLYYRVTMPNAIQFGLLDVINRVRGTRLTPAQFLADCRKRSRLEEVYEQTYLCNPCPGASGIVEWSDIENCRMDYSIERLHLEADQVRAEFGVVTPYDQPNRQELIRQIIRSRFPKLFQNPESSYRLGFDVAASGQGNLTAIYIDEKKDKELWLRALFTCRTSDWHFIKTVLFTFMADLRYAQGAGDETSLGRQICSEAATQFGYRFRKINFASKKHDLGFSLMNQLSVAQKRFPRSEQDIAADYFALRKKFRANKWIFTEGKNQLNPSSHCDIAWAGGLATEANQIYFSGGAEVI